MAQIKENVHPPSSVASLAQAFVPPPFLGLYRCLFLELFAGRHRGKVTNLRKDGTLLGAFLSHTIIVVSSLLLLSLLLSSVTVGGLEPPRFSD